LIAVLGAFITIASACSNQGEGERCEALNGNDDCRTEEGLICYPANQLKDTNSDRCCPADRRKATQPVCKTSTDVGTDATAPPDTGPPPGAEAGAGADAAEAGSSDAGEDADAADQ